MKASPRIQALLTALSILAATSLSGEAAASRRPLAGRTMAYSPDTVVYAPASFQYSSSTLRAIPAPKDSLAAADSVAAFNAWYEGLSPQERRKYDYEQKIKLKMAYADSVRTAREDRKALRDSIAEAKPRILETFAFPDTMQYKRIIAWTVDPDFHKVKPFLPDTTYDFHFNEYEFRRNDVNATWLGVQGSPVQSYVYFRREGLSGVDFYENYESWSFDVRNLPHYNTKTPQTELAYYGTLLATEKKESDNIHMMTTQNILPELNFTLLYDRWGGGGMLGNEETKNKTAVVDINYTGKRYMAHAGLIHNKIQRQENGGVSDRASVRDTTIDSREMPVSLTDASSRTLRNTFYLDQQLRVALGRDTSSTINRNMTSMFIGHSTEYSIFNRTYRDEIGASDNKDFYKFYNFSETASSDSLGLRRLDNKFFVRLQPWSESSFVSKLNVGVGDVLKHYYDSSSVRGTSHKENTFYLYAGVEGQYKKYFDWDAKSHFSLAGANAGDFDVEANARFNFYPFRRARTSPLSLGVHFETSLKEPSFYQKYLNTNHFSWENDFGKISTTKIQGTIDIPYWKLDARVGYALLSNNIFYDECGMARQNTKAMSVLSAYIHKKFVVGGWLHLDNKVLLQTSSNQAVVPVPAAAFNLRYYAQFVVQRNAAREKVMEMQVGLNAFYNTSWHSPAYNPVFGVFYNQVAESYNNGPVFDVFVNVQWKRACVFIRMENLGQGWPMKKFDWFSADRYILPQRGTSSLKLGIFWPFHLMPNRNPAVSLD